MTPAELPLPEPTLAQWHRLHPLSPLLRGGRLLLAVVALTAQRSLADLSTSGVRYLPVLVALPVVLAVAYVQWRVTRWRVEDGDLRLETGLLLRRSRRVPLARLQAVDIVRPLAARVTGLAELRLEVVGHSGAEAALAYLSEEQAARIRAQLLAVAGSGGVHPAAVAPRAAAAPEPGRPAVGAELLAEVPTGLLLASVVLSPAAVTTAALGLTMLGAGLAPGAGGLGLLAGGLPALLASGTVAWRSFAREFEFRLVQTSDGLTITHGMLETRSQTVPRDRVQAVRVVEPALWRLLPITRDWARVEVIVAGYRGGRRDAGAETGVLLPVGPKWLAGALVGRVLPDVAVGTPPPLRPPRRALLRAPLRWRRLGLAYDERAVTTTSGVFGRSYHLVPHAKLQSIRRTQGPLERRLRLATVHLDVAGRPLHAAARHRDAPEAELLLGELSRLGRAARRTAVPTPRVRA